MTNVIPTTWILKFNQSGMVDKSNILLIISLDKIMIDTFIKLLEIKMVANSAFGVANNFLISKWIVESDAFKISLSLGVKEKNATSDAEISAEKKRSTIKTNKENSIPIENGFKIPRNKANVK